jgi:hypothetical protein
MKKAQIIQGFQSAFSFFWDKFFRACCGFIISRKNALFFLLKAIPQQALTVLNSLKTHDLLFYEFLRCCFSISFYFYEIKPFK